MPDRLLWILRTSTALMIFSGFLALGSDRNYGMGLLIIPLVLLPLAPLGAYLESRVRLWRQLRQAAAFLYIFFIPVSLQMFGLMNAVILLVIFIQAYLLLGTKTVRVYYELFLMSFFMLLAAVVQSPESAVAIALLLYGVSAVWAFATLRMFVEMTGSPMRSNPEMSSPGQGAAQFKPGNVFDFGLVVSLSALSLVSLLITVVMFVLTPRVEAGWLGRRDARQAITGLSETVRIAGGSSIYEDPTIIMQAAFPEEDRGRLAPSSLLYWRVTSLSRFTEDEWSRRGLEAHYEPDIPSIISQGGRSGWGGGTREVRRPQRPDSRSIRQSIYMDDVPAQGIPCLDLPYGLQIISESPHIRASWDPTGDFTLLLDTRGTRSLQYEAFSDVVEHSPEALRAAPFDYRFVAPRDYSLLTYHELLPETQQRALDLTASIASAYEKVKAIETWLSGDAFSYSLDVPALPSEHGMDAFINTLRKGHCELFASALALMVRSLGIPARVVSGYRGGDYSEPDEAYMVRANMSHLWVEVLFKDIGWVRFDPSPRSDFEPTGLRRMRMVWSTYVLRGKIFWHQRIVGFRGGIRLDQLFSYRPWKRKSQAAEPAAVLESPSAEKIPHWNLAEYRGFTALAALSIAVGILFLWHRRRTGQNALKLLTRDQQKIRLLYLQFVKKASALGVDCRNKTATEIWEDLKQLPLSDKELVHRFILAYHRIRFGGRPFDKTVQEQGRMALRSLKLVKERE